MDTVQSPGSLVERWEKPVRVLLVGGTGVIGSQIGRALLKLASAVRTGGGGQFDGAEAVEVKVQEGKAKKQKKNKQKQKQKKKRVFLFTQSTRTREGGGGNEDEGPDFRGVAFEVLIGGRNEEKGTAVVKSLTEEAAKREASRGKAEEKGETSDECPGFFSARYVKLDNTNRESLDAAMVGVHLVIHSASPFQKQRPLVYPLSLYSHAQTLCKGSHSNRRVTQEQNE